MYTYLNTFSKDNIADMSLEIRITTVTFQLHSFTFSTLLLAYFITQTILTVYSKCTDFQKMQEPLPNASCKKHDAKQVS